MNLKKLCGLAFILLLMPITGCDNHVYSDEENFSDWIKGRDYALKFDATKDKYTANVISDSYTNDVLDYKDTCVEAKDGEKYYSNIENYALDEDTNKLELDIKSLIVIKEEDDKGTIRNKFYRELFENEENSKDGYYVAPYYADYFSEYAPNNDNFEDYLISGNTIDEFNTNFNSYYLEENKITIDSITFNRNKDKSISLLVKGNRDFVSEFIEDEDYTNTNITYDFEVKVKNGKIIEIINGSKEKEIYKDENKNVTYDSKTTITFDYNFDDKYYNQLSIETDTTINTYYGSVSFNILGYDFRYLDDETTLFGEEYTSEQAIEFLLSKYTFFIGKGEEKFDASYFSLYLDKDFTQPFTKVDEMSDSMTLYVKFNIPSDKAIVAYVFVNEKSEEKHPVLKIMYLEDVGNTYDASKSFEGYKILSIDGVEVSEGEETNFKITENKVYIIVCDSNGVMM